MGSSGERIGGSTGVGGKEEAFEDVGVGLEESLVLPVATGKLSESRFGLRGVYDRARVCLTGGRGGGDIGNCDRLGEVPTWGLGEAKGWPVSPGVRIASTEARSIEVDR